ncbi:Sec8 exocyst complex component-specific domain-containing protein [Scheffersomyces xylosifermentans]|uniref:Sec8 exocyst complex component-specific domain-containing protein n=1 Tax=Scheffersomyces xylosifermentans TaxID=1304137 RepID=UPI00315DE7CC
MVNRRLSFNMPPGGAQSRRAIDESIFELKEVQNTLKYDWPQFLQDDANPIETAVSLLDDTSVGLAHRYPEFEHVMKSTETALRHVVNEHHELFNNSIGSYHLLLSTLQDSQNDSTAIKEMLEFTTKETNDRSDVLNDLSHSSARYSEMIEVLDAISEVTAIPDKIDQLVIDKKMHEVYDVISNGYKVAEKYNLWSLSAMSSMQNYLEIQSNNLFDMIVDELQNEIYQKGSTSRTTETDKSSIGAFNLSWQALADSNNPKLASFKTLIAESHNLEQYIYNSANLDITDIVDVLCEPVELFINKQLPKVHSHFSGNEGGVNYSILLDSTSNASAASFHYIYMLLHTAARLSRLHQVVEILVNSNQSELHGMISRATETVKSRNGLALAKLAKLQNYDQRTIADVVGNSNFSDSAVVVLQDLFGSIFIQTLAVLQRHKVVSEIVNLIEQGQTISGPTKGVTTSAAAHLENSNSYKLVTVWNIMKKELQSIMVNYINDDSHVKADANNEVLKGKNKSKIYDTLSKKDAFHFVDVSYKKSTTANPDLQTILQDMFPGFVINETENSKSGLIDSSSPYIQNENFNAMVEVLVPRNSYNMRIILEFLLIFVEGSQRLLNNFGHSNTPTNQLALQFFDDFMKISFLAHVRESLDLSFTEYIGGAFIHAEHDKGGIAHVAGLKLDLISLTRNADVALITNNATDSGFTVIYENALNFKKLLLNVCSVLNTSLTYRPEFSDTVLHFVESFAGVYSHFYQELLSTGSFQNSAYNSTIDSSNKPISQISRWMRIPALIQLSTQILGSTDTKTVTALTAKESQIMVQAGEAPTKAFEISKDDLLDVDSFNQVCYLLLTTSWILTWLPLVQKESNYDVLDDDSDAIKLSVVDRLRYNWSFLENGRNAINVNAGNTDISQQNIYLALSSDKIERFGEMISNFESIRDNTLLALRYDLRCKAIYYIGRSFKESDWMPTTEPGDADAPIGMLNKEVFSIDAKVSKMLSPSEREGIFVGLPAFLNQLLIQGSTLVHKMNSNGIKRILLNIFTLQQMLRNLSKNPETVDFTRSSVYFELFTMNEFNLLNYVKTNEQKYSLGELNNMARLIYSEKLADGNGTQFNKTKQSDLLKKIAELVK